ncbi:MAG: hypothetical protein KG003_15325 [Bacteroidetes bacterium]|nr:hypothetical protein [Bacteroidota bacterium]
MNKENQHMPDDLFRENLSGFEMPYNDAAWEDMRNLLDKADKKRPFVLWFQKNKKSTITLITITMLTTLIAVFTLAKYNHTALTHSNSELKSTENKKSNTEISVNKNSENNYSKDAENIATFNPTTEGLGDKKTANSSASPSYSTTSEVGLKQNAKTSSEETPSNPTSSVVGNDALANATNAESTNPTTSVVGAKPLEQTTRFDNIAKISGVSAVQKPSNSNGKNPTPYGNFRGPWIGIHFTMQDPEKPLAMDSGRQQAGFNFQIMSANLLDNQWFGAYLGMDFGMQFYGRGEKYGVVLNNTSQDSGYTRLSMHSFDFFARGHFEFGRLPLKPYVNVFAGPRIYAASQYTESYSHKTDYENNSRTNALTTASFMYGGAVGLRLAVSRHVSLDGRVEYMSGTDTKIADLDKSNFDGGLATYKLQTIKLQPAYYQFKFGVLFDLWDDYEEDYDREENRTEVSQDKEYYYYDSTTSQYIKVRCSCTENPAGQDTSNNNSESGKTSNRNYFDIDHTKPVDQWERQRTRGSSRVSPGYYPGGSSGRSGRGSFPGIKAGGSGIKIKN